VSTLEAPVPESPRGPARVVLQGFDGPLDVLLHLVRTGDLDITGMPVTEVVRQCDAYIRLVEDLDLEGAADHLVMAATLVHMKSRSLLPPDPEAELAADPEDEGLSPRLRGFVQELRRAAEQLQEREAAMELVYTRPAGRVAEFAGEQGFEADLYSLVSAFQAILQRLGAEPAESRISREKVTLMERVTWLIDTLTAKRRLAFSELFQGLGDRFGLILTFLALLEVLRLRIARAFQSHRQADILIVLAEEAPTAAGDTARGPEEEDRRNG
jgi:segregation and condensation protein A